jgi:uncharacterized protein YqjF (DUF2071 family)
MGTNLKRAIETLSSERKSNKMSRLLRIVPIDDTAPTATALEYMLLRRFGFHRTVDKKTTSLWFMDLEGYNWTMEDANFMENLARDGGEVCGWAFLGYRREEYERD